MSKVLQNATAHFKNQVAGEMKSVEVKQWDTTIYFRPVTTFAQQMKVIEYTAKGDQASALIETVIQRCLDENGKKVFTHADWDVLMNQVDPEVLISIVGVMNRSNKKAEEELGN